jgi:hypothetical protein
MTRAELLRNEHASGLVDAYLAVWVFLFAEVNTFTHTFIWIHGAVTAAILCAKILA